MAAASRDRQAKDRERKRRERERRRAGIGIYKITLTEDVGEALANRGLLSPSVSDQPEAVSRALARLLIRTLNLPE